MVEQKVVSMVNELSAQAKQRSVMWLKIKLLIGLALFMVGMPILIYLSFSYFINRGIMTDTFLMASEHKAEVEAFYQKQGRCPVSSEMKPLDKENEPFVGQLGFESDKNTCFIVVQLKELPQYASQKKLILSATFDGVDSQVSWHCSSNANHWFLVSQCESHLPQGY